jgi:hypothetical protein
MAGCVDWQRVQAWIRVLVQLAMPQFIAQASHAHQQCSAYHFGPVLPDCLSLSPAEMHPGILQVPYHTT